MYLHTNWYFTWLYQWNWMFIQFFKWKLLSLNTLSDSLNSKSRLSFLLYVQLLNPNSVQIPSKFNPNSVQISIVIFSMYLHTNWYFRWLYQWNWMFIQFFKWKLLSLNTLSDSLNSKSHVTCELKFPKSKGLLLRTFSQNG